MPQYHDDDTQASRSSKPTPFPELVHPNIFLAGLLLTGYVVLRQVKRILALSRYYEHRPET